MISFVQRERLIRNTIPGSVSRDQKDITKFSERKSSDSIMEEKGSG